MVTVQSLPFSQFITIHITDSCNRSRKVFTNMNSLKICQISLELNDILIILSYEVYFYITSKEIIMG